MKPNGAPDLVGETRYQAGATATAVVVDGRLQWEVRRHGDDHVRYTDRLAHISHWSTERELSALRRSPVADFPRLGGPAGGTLFYPDCSNNNWNSEQDAVDFVNQLIPQGFSGMCHKVSEGDYYEDPFWPVVLQACRDANLPVLGYHYVTSNDGGSQAQTYLAAGGLPNAMFDWEANGGDLANYYAVATAFNTAGVNVGVGYCPRWYFDEVGGGDLSQAGAIVSSAYPGGTGYASQIYEAAGGDEGSGWAPYGGVTPTCWQFTDQALVAGITVDCNAFKGTEDQLAQLFTGGTVTQPESTEQQEIDAIAGQLGAWPQLAGKPDALAVLAQKIADGDDLTLVDAVAAHIFGLLPVQTLAPIGGPAKLGAMSPNAGAIAQTVMCALAGIDAQTGAPLSYRQVDQLHEYEGPGVYFPPEAPGQTTSSVLDVETTSGKVGLRLYKGLDWFDMIVALYQQAGEPTPKAAS